MDFFLQHSMFLFSDGHDLPTDSRHSAFNNGSFIIKRPRKILDQGYYTCSASNNKQESHSGSVQIRVISKSWPLFFHPEESFHHRVFWLVPMTLTSLMSDWFSQWFVYVLFSVFQPRPTSCLSCSPTSCWRRGCGQPWRAKSWRETSPLISYGRRMVWPSFPLSRHPTTGLDWRYVNKRHQQLFQLFWN